MKQILLTAAVAVSLLQTAFAVCDAPTGVSFTTTNITCPGTGKVTVTGVTVNATPLLLTNCRYALYDASNSTIIKPLQSNPELSGLDAGTYTLHVFQYCSSTELSQDYIQQVQVGGSYTPLSLTTPTVSSSDCNSGSITVSAQGGYGTLFYCLVDSLNAPITPTHFVSPPQASGSFINIPAATYYVRAYDQCPAFIGTTVTVDSVAASSPFAASAGYYMYIDGCAGWKMTLFLAHAVHTDNNTHVWISYPDGTVDTLSTSISSIWDVPLPTSKMVSFPATVTYHYQNACNTQYSYDFIINQPDYKINNQLAERQSCDTAVFRINTPSLNDLNNVLYNAIYLWDSISVDNGVTWIPYIQSNNDSILIPMTDSAKLIYRWCGHDLPFTVYTPTPATFHMSAYQYGRANCSPNGGIQLYVDPNDFNGNPNKILVQVTSVPAGQAPVSSFFFSHTSSSTWGYDPPGLSNLVPGTYTFHFTDECGDTTSATATVQPFTDTLTATPIFTCGLSTVDMNIHYGYDNSIGGSYFINYELRDTSNNLVYAGSAYGASDIPLNGYTPRIYRIKAWKTSYDGTISTELTCPWNLTVDARLPAPVTLSRSSFAICTNATSTGMIIAQATGGIPPYNYSLYRDSVTASTLVSGPAANNVYTNLDVSRTYIIVATDACSGYTYSTVFENVQPVISTSTTLVPCPGDSITLSISPNDNLFYQWTKNDTDIVNAITPSYSINNVAATDSGVYQVRIAANACVLLSSAILINPNDCGIPFPLPIELVIFNGAVNTQQNAVLTWKTAHEEPNTVFSVWYSTDGSHFSKAGSVPGNAAGNTYSFTHSDYKLTGETYYKLTLTDATGTDKYSPVVSLKAGQQSNSRMKVSPVPFTGSMHVIYYTANAGNVILQLTDISGRVLKTQSATVAKGANSISINELDALPNGTYFLQATDETGQMQALKVQK